MWREDVPGWSQQDELMANAVEAVDTWSRRIFAATLFQATGKWPPDHMLGTPIRIEHPDRQTAARGAETDENGKPKITRDPHAIARFFGLKPKKRG